MALFADKLADMFSTKSGENEMRAFWDKLDKDGDQKISGKEWGSKVFAEQELMSKYFGGTSLKEIGEGFNRIDSNGDDALTWDEFRSEIASYKVVKSMKEAFAKEESKAELKTLWDSLDANADGKVDGKEWGSKVYANKDVMSKFFGGSDMASIGKGFNRIDSNNDDQLTWDEFTAAVDSY
jgi:Ca2+-binding EF-hand superfamily protein